MVPHDRLPVPKFCKELWLSKTAPVKFVAPHQVFGRHNGDHMRLHPAVEFRRHLDRLNTKSSKHPSLEGLLTFKEGIKPCSS